MMTDTAVLASDIREARKEIGKLHEKVDGYASGQTTLIHQMDKRLTILEEAEKHRPKLEQPCRFLIEFKKEQEQHEAKKEEVREKWRDRAVELALKYVPTIAALAAAGYVAMKGGNPQEIIGK